MSQPTWNYDHRKAQDRMADELHMALPKTQAERVVAKFGGPYRMAHALAALPDPTMHRSPSVIYRWLWTSRGGRQNVRNGRIPVKAWDGILKAARLHGIFLSAEDMKP